MAGEIDRSMLEKLTAPFEHTCCANSDRSRAGKAATRRSRRQAMKWVRSCQAHGEGPSPPGPLPDDGAGSILPKILQVAQEKGWSARTTNQ